MKFKLCATVSKNREFPFRAITIFLSCTFTDALLNYDNADTSADSKSATDNRVKDCYK